MTSRERSRKQKSINHQQSDRVPGDVGQDMHTASMKVACANPLKLVGEFQTGQKSL